jgi:hypothetical protein
MINLNNRRIIHFNWISIIILVLNFTLQADCQNTDCSIVFINQEKEAIDYALIEITNLQSNNKEFKFTDERGQIQISFNDSIRINIVATHLMYEKTEQNLNLYSNDTLVRIVMNENNVLLSEVLITDFKKKTSISSDVMTINIDGSKSLGVNALEIFQNIPGINLNRESLSLIGKPVRVQINGKRINFTNTQLLNFIKGKNAGSIKKIEVQLNPDSKNEADFDGGIINIITENEGDGIQNNIILEVVRRSVHYSNSINGDINIQKGNLNISGNIGHDINNQREQRNSTQKINGNSLMIDDRSIIDGFSKGPNYMANIDYQYKNNLFLGVKLEGFQNSDSTNMMGNSTLIKMIPSTINTVLEDLSNQKVDFINVNLNLKKVFSNSSINFDFDKGRRSADLQNNQTLDSFDINNNLMGTRLINQYNKSSHDLFGMKLDYNKKFGKSNFSTGIQWTYTDLNQSLTETSPFVPNGFLDDMIQFEETIYSTYQDFKTNHFGLDFAAGNRIELTKYQGNINSENITIDSNYVNIFPYVRISKNYRKHYLSLNFRKNIRRPSYRDLIPFKRYTGSFSYFTGNPELLPYFPLTTSFYYSFDNILWVNLSYQRINNKIMEFDQLLENLNIREGIKRNNGNSDNFNFVLGYNKKINKFTMINTTAVYSTGKQVLNLTNAIYDFNFNAISLSFNGIFDLNSKLKLNTSFFYNSDIYYSAEKTLSYWYLDFRLNYSLLNGNGDLFIAVNDVFLRGINRAESIYADIFLSSSNNWDSRKVTAGFSYFFGSNTIKQKRERSPSSNSATINRLP